MEGKQETSVKQEQKATHAKRKGESKLKKEEEMRAKKAQKVL